MWERYGLEEDDIYDTSLKEERSGGAASIEESTVSCTVSRQRSCIITPVLS